MSSTYTKKKNKPGEMTNHAKRMVPRPLATDMPLWDRQQGETDKAWQGWVIYRDLPREERSIRRAALLGGTAKSNTGEWAVIWSWTRRLEAYERHLDQIRVKAHENEVRDMAKRHANLARGALGALQAPVRELVERISDGRLNLKAMSHKELLTFVSKSSRAIRDLIEVERVSNSLPATTALVGVVHANANGQAPTNAQLGLPPASGSTVADTVLRMFKEAGVDLTGTAGHAADIVDGEIVGDDDDA